MCLPYPIATSNAVKRVPDCGASAPRTFGKDRTTNGDGGDPATIARGSVIGDVMAGRSVTANRRTQVGGSMRVQQALQEGNKQRPGQTHVAKARSPVVLVTVIVRAATHGQSVSLRQLSIPQLLGGAMMRVIGFERRQPSIRETWNQAVASQKARMGKRTNAAGS